MAWRSVSGHRSAAAAYVHILEKCATRRLPSAGSLELAQATALSLVEESCSRGPAMISRTGRVDCVLNRGHRSLLLEFGKGLWFVNLQAIFEALRVARDRKFVWNVLCLREWSNWNLLLLDEWVEMTKDRVGRFILILFFQLFQIV